MKLPSVFALCGTDETTQHVELFSEKNFENFAVFGNL